MKKELMIRTLQSPINRANIKMKDGFIILFGHDVHIITYNERTFCCDANKILNGINFQYSEVKSIEVFS